MANKRIALNTKSRKLVMHETMTGYAFMLPFLVFFVMFVLYPMFMCVYTSFFDATLPVFFDSSSSACNFARFSSVRSILLSSSSAFVIV